MILIVLSFFFNVHLSCLSFLSYCLLALSSLSSRHRMSMLYFFQHILILSSVHNAVCSCAVRPSQPPARAALYPAWCKVYCRLLCLTLAVKHWWCFDTFRHKRKNISDSFTHKNSVLVQGMTGELGGGREPQSPGWKSRGWTSCYVVCSSHLEADADKRVWVGR